MNFLTSLICKATKNHKAEVVKIFSKTERKVSCLRCGKSWAMHDSYGFLIEWDEWFEDHYSEEANQKREYMNMLSGRWRKEDAQTTDSNE